jgi:hypothetical protein
MTRAFAHFPNDVCECPLVIKDFPFVTDFPTPEKEGTVKNRIIYHNISTDEGKNIIYSLSIMDVTRVLGVT